MRACRIPKLVSVAVLAGASLAAIPTSAQDSVLMDSGTLDQEAAGSFFPAKRPYSPWAGRNFPTRPLFGDTHLHTSFSMDAGAFGARLSPRDAYRFAKGEEVMASSGQAGETLPAARFPRGHRPLRQYGLLPGPARRQARAPRRPAGPQMVRHDSVRPGGRGRGRHHHLLRGGQVQGADPLFARIPPPTARRGRRPSRRRRRRTSPAASPPSSAIEWTSNTGGNNLHRNVIFRDDGDKASQVVPFTRAAAGQRQSARPVEMDGGLRGQDRRRRARHRP